MIYCFFIVAIHRLNKCLIKNRRINTERFKFNQSSTMSEIWETNPLIPSYVKPIDYDILITPNLKAGLFDGTVAISFQLTDLGSYIPIHVKNLEVMSSSLVEENGQPVPVRIVHCVKNQFWVLTPLENQKSFQPGIYKLDLSFKGNLTGKIVGFYRSLYLDDKTMEKR